jgi:uncharacterized protein DUF6702
MAVQLYQWLLLSIIHFTSLSGGSGVASIIPGKNIKSPHPFYISVTEINHNSKDNILEISCKLFAEDFEQTLCKNYKTQLNISSQKDKAASDKLISDYMDKHLSLSVDGKKPAMSYIGYEKEKESVYCYFQVDHIGSFKKIDITNSILYDFNENEINIMHVVVNGRRQSSKLDFPNVLCSFSF